MADQDVSTPPVKTAILAYGALGIVFGDIGTSPLYALQEAFAGEHGLAVTRANILGTVSLVIWSLLLVVTFKYVFIVMRAANDGEGGVLALLALSPTERQRARRGRIAAITLVGIAGAALMYGDGVITPAISVLAAVEGVAYFRPSAAPWIVPVVCAILLALFMIQRHGTERISRVFAPVMIGWFILIGVLGARALSQNWSALEALSPFSAIAHFQAHGVTGIRVLGAVVLAVTGCEALYADMGHFGRRPIAFSWALLVLPALILSYLGQAAVLLDTPGASERPFYAMVPTGPISWGVVAIATAATVIASQALITGIYSLTRQAVQLGLFPRVSILHTSADMVGQIFVPSMTWFLAVAGLVLVIAFRSSAALASAFGFAVSTTMLLTSVLFLMVARWRFAWPRSRIIGLALVLFSIDLPFVAANTLKFWDGGYVPVAIAVAVSMVMVSWRVGRELLAHRVREEAARYTRLLSGIASSVDHRPEGAAVFMTSFADGAPPALVRLVQKFRVLHETTLLVTVETQLVPFVHGASKHSIEPLGDGLYRVKLRYGFMETPQIPPSLAQVLARAGHVAWMEDIVYVLGKERITPGPDGHMNRVLEAVFALLMRNVPNVTDYFGIPRAQVVELGAQVDL